MCRLPILRYTWQNYSVVTTRKRTIVWSSFCGLRISRNISSFYDRSLRCRLIRSQNPQWCNLLEPKGFSLSFPGLGWRCAVATFLPCQTQKGETSVSWNKGHWICPSKLFLCRKNNQLIADDGERELDAYVHHILYQLFTEHLSPRLPSLAAGSRSTGRIERENTGAQIQLHQSN